MADENIKTVDDSSENEGTSTSSLNGLALKSRDGYTGKLFLPSTADIATLNTAQADITTIQNSISTIDPTARFIVSRTEPSTADDGKIWIEVEPRYSIDRYACSKFPTSLLSNGVYTVPVLVTDTAYEMSLSIKFSDLPSNQLICYPGKTITNNGVYGSIFLQHSSVGTSTGTVTMMVSGPLEITSFKPYVGTGQASDTATINSSSYNSTSALVSLTHTRRASSGQTYYTVNVDYEITATGTGTGSIMFSPCTTPNGEDHIAWKVSTGLWHCVGKNGAYSYVRRITN